MFEDLLIYRYNVNENDIGPRELINYAFKNNIAVGNIWHNYLTNLILNDENAFTLACERQNIKSESLSFLGRHDLEIFRNLFEIGVNYDLDGEFNNPVCLLAKIIADSPKDEIFNIVTEYFKNYGVGIFANNKAFRFDGLKSEFIPVKHVGNINLNDIIGYELQKQELISNTEAFINNKPANNVLLYGDGGTGKSSSIKALLNKYFDQGLRVIEIYKYQFRDILKITNLIRERNYYFILFIDDLSFEENESEYKYLKAVIEGGIETRPENILIYATSNRRHIIREIWSDRDDMEHNGDIHRSDTVEEKLSLASRFGIALNYSAPDRNMYHEIIKNLALKSGIKINSELFKNADAWEIRHGGKSGRAAKQYIDYLLGKL